MTRMGYYCDIRYSKSIWKIWDVWNITGLFTSICDICGYVWYTISIWKYLQSWYEWKITGILDWTINGILASGYYWNNITYNTIRDTWIHTHIYINRNAPLIIQQTQQNESLWVYKIPIVSVSDFANRWRGKESLGPASPCASRCPLGHPQLGLVNEVNLGPQVMGSCKMTTKWLISGDVFFNRHIGVTESMLSVCHIPELYWV